MRSGALIEAAKQRWGRNNLLENNCLYLALGAQDAEEALRICVIQRSHFGNGSSIPWKVTKEEAQRALWNAHQEEAELMLKISFADIGDFMDAHPDVIEPTPWVQGYRYNADIQLREQQEGIIFTLHPIDMPDFHAPPHLEFPAGHR